jgi:hypothetical protein
MGFSVELPRLCLGMPVARRPVFLPQAVKAVCRPPLFAGLAHGFVARFAVCPILVGQEKQQ